MVAWLTESSGFPRVEESTPEGVVAVGGDLSPERLIMAYRQGIFPWYGPGQPILWWSPDPRAILPLDEFRIGRSLRKILRREEFEIRFNTAFSTVIRACGVRADGSPSGWITDDMVDAYTELHRRGHAHSVEVWRCGELIGGLYGVSLGGLFAGESMFYRAANASKFALVALVERLTARGFVLLDCQMLTPVTEPMGAREIARSAYLARLADALGQDCSFLDGPLGQNT